MCIGFHLLITGTDYFGLGWWHIPFPQCCTKLVLTFHDARILLRLEGQVLHWRDRPQQTCTRSQGRKLYTRNLILEPFVNHFYRSKLYDARKSQNKILIRIHFSILERKSMPCARTPENYSEYCTRESGRCGLGDTGYKTAGLSYLPHDTLSII
jgi:hypothetical protein